ncbi:MAG: hypothetical protein ACK5JD_17175 [Mangrovibacterium sp.]
MKEVIAIFDIGKTNKKILLFDSEWKLVYQHEQKFVASTDEDGFECDDIDRITDWIRTELADLFAGGQYDVKAVNFRRMARRSCFWTRTGNASRRFITT